MPARLTLLPAERPSRALLLREGRAYVVGRDAACELAVDDARVSRRHARLEGAAAGWTLSDLGSKNGTRVDGAPAGIEMPLAGPCWLSLRGLLARFEPLTEQQATAAEEERRRRWQTSLALRRRLDPAAGTNALLSRLIESVLAVAGAERGCVLLAGDRGELAVAASAGWEGEAPAGSSFTGSRGAAARALAEGRTLVRADAATDADLGARASVAAGGIRSLLCVPLAAAGRPIGVLYADSRRPGSGFDELDVEIVEALAAQRSSTWWPRA